MAVAYQTKKPIWIVRVLCEAEYSGITILPVKGTWILHLFLNTLRSWTTTSPLRWCHLWTAPYLNASNSNSPDRFFRLIRLEKNPCITKFFLAWNTLSKFKSCLRINVYLFPIRVRELLSTIAAFRGHLLFKYWCYVLIYSCT